MTSRTGESPTGRRALSAAGRIAMVVAAAGVLLYLLLYNGRSDSAVLAENAGLTTGAERANLGKEEAGDSGLLKSGTQKNTLASQAATVPYTKTLGVSEFGLGFVNSAETNSGAGRIQRGVDTGVRMDRFPVYWEQVEKRIGEFTWTGQDAAILANEGKNLNTLAILLGTPRQYRLGSRSASTSLGGSFTELPENFAPRSADCLPQEAGGECDLVGVVDASGRQLRVTQDGLQGQSGSCQRHEGPPAPFGLWNPIFTDGSDVPSNDARLNPTNPWARFVGAAVTRYMPGGDAGTHIRHWEIWNEPDLCHFWSGTPQEYARLLKVAYIVIKWLDPEAYVVFGGLAHFENGQWLYDMLDALEADSLSIQNSGFFDAAGSHHYSLSYVGYQYTRKVRNALDVRGWGDKPIWITESGVPVCNDYPGPTCPSPWRATANEQASYIWQNIAYTRLAGGGPIFHFMLHDDCGNVVAVESPDGFGLAKNESISFCSPSNAETRLAYTAFELANQHFPGTEVAWADIERFRVRRIAFYHPGTEERRLLMWSLNTQAQTAKIPATGTSGRLINLDGTTTVVTPTAGVYEVSLAGATNTNWPDGQGGYSMGIYGEPVLLVETDTMSPTASILDLPAYSPQTFPVTWLARDWGSGVISTSVYVKVEDGDWELWKEGVEAYGKASYTGEAGKKYAFSVAAEDRLGYKLQADTSLAETTIAEHSSVTGRVINPAGESGVGVQVSIGTTTATTDAGGRFTMTVPIGSWNISVGNQLLMRRRVFGTSESLALLYSPGTNAVTNGDFENAFNSWTKSGSSSSQIEAQPGTSDHALRLASEFVPNDGVPGTEGSDGGNSTVSQRVTVPTGRPYLAIAYKVETTEPDTGTDKFEVIAVEDGQPANYMLVQSQSSGWQYRSFDMAQYAGKEINLIFNVYETSPNRRTTALIDVVTLSDVPAQNLQSSGPAARPRPAKAPPPPPASAEPSRQEGNASSGYRVFLPTVLNLREQ
ncbi:MAG: hypothetical protein OXJ55_20925 [Caldilineaceae bacterium]|nr:hypothetical protein [Caldilineaceae bacterium]